MNNAPSPTLPRKGREKALSFEPAAGREDLRGLILFTI
jgi:hypothetical protein